MSNLISFYTTQITWARMEDAARRLPYTLLTIGDANYLEDRRYIVSKPSKDDEVGLRPGFPFFHAPVHSPIKSGCSCLRYFLVFSVPYQDGRVEILFSPTQLHHPLLNSRNFLSLPVRKRNFACASDSHISDSANHSFRLSYRS